MKDKRHESGEEWQGKRYEKSWVSKDTDTPTRIFCEIQYDNGMAENLTRTFHQNPEIIGEFLKKYKQTVEELASSVGKRIDIIQNHVNKRVIDLSKNVRNLNRELCRTSKKWWI